jgi:hypothetical protein
MLDIFALAAIVPVSRTFQAVLLHVRFCTTTSFNTKSSCIGSYTCTMKLCKSTPTHKVCRMLAPGNQVQWEERHQSVSSSAFCFLFSELKRPHSRLISRPCLEFGCVAAGVVKSGGSADRGSPVAQQSPVVSVWDVARIVRLLCRIINTSKPFAEFLLSRMRM